MIYLDNSATTRQYDAVTETMLSMMRSDFGNPSSLHRMGVTAEKAVKTARKALARSLGAGEDEICFTAGGTESDNMALFGAAQARKRRGDQIITCAAEHPAVLEPCRRLEAMGFQVERIGVNHEGIIDLEAFKDALCTKTILVSVMHVNNEVGSIQPIEEIGRLTKTFAQNNGIDILVHSDAVQSYGKLHVRAGLADLISLSGHKIHGPKGIGALYINKNCRLEPYLYGGGQEKGRRSGTENVPAIAGLGKAAEISCTGLNERYNAMGKAKDYLQNGILSELKDIKINGSLDSCCASVLNVSFIGVRAEVLLHTLEQSDIYVSTGSACSSNKRGLSHVLKSMGLSDKEIEGTIRFSFSEFNTVEEMDFVLQRLKDGVNKFRKLGSFR